MRPHFLPRVLRAYCPYTVGYGDILPTPGNLLEMASATLIMLLGSFLWARVVAIFVIASTRAPDELDFQSTVDQLNQFMHNECVPRELQIRLREYFFHTKHVRATAKAQKLLQLMSGTLRAEVAWELNERWLAAIAFLNEAPKAFLVQLSLRLSPLVFAPNELCPADQLYIIHRGLALYNGQLLGVGRVWCASCAAITLSVPPFFAPLPKLSRPLLPKGFCVLPRPPSLSPPLAPPPPRPSPRPLPSTHRTRRGEDMILGSPHLKGTADARALTFLDVLTIGQSELFVIAEAFPVTRRQIRSYAIRLALKRTLLREARLRKQAEERGEEYVGLPERFEGSQKAEEEALARRRRRLRAAGTTVARLKERMRDSGEEGGHVRGGAETAAAAVDASMEANGGGGRIPGGGSAGGMSGERSGEHTPSPRTASIRVVARLPFEGSLSDDDDDNNSSDDCVAVEARAVTVRKSPSSLEDASRVGALEEAVHILGVQGVSHDAKLAKLSEDLRLVHTAVNSLSGLITATIVRGDIEVNVRRNLARVSSASKRVAAEGHVRPLTDRGGESRTPLHAPPPVPPRASQQPPPSRPPTVPPTSSASHDPRSTTPLATDATATEPRDDLPSPDASTILAGGGLLVGRDAAAQRHGGANTPMSAHVEGLLQTCDPLTPLRDLLATHVPTDLTPSAAALDHQPPPSSQARRTRGETQLRI